MAPRRRRSPAEFTTPQQGQHVDSTTDNVTVAGAAVKAAKCGALTDGLTRCARPPEPGSQRCELHQGR
jgi:hypothetical protein